MIDLLMLLGGGILLYFGAEWFVGGASSLALALRVPQLLVGLTVVAYGTSAPEVVVGIEAAAGGHGDVALGNVVGSNVANVGLILGVAALIRPARVDGDLRRRELPVLLISAALFALALVDGVVQRWEGAALLAIAAAYTVVMVRAARSASAADKAVERAEAVATAADAAGAPTVGGARGVARAAVTAVVGLGVLLVGGNVFIDGAVSLAASMGMSERLVGLTIVAVGTSLPELVTSVVAARRGNSDIAVGNVVGSNIFNVLLCLGASALTSPLHAPGAAIWVDLGALALMTGVAAVFIRTERSISRLEGAGALVLYAALLVGTIVRG